MEPALHQQLAAREQVPLYGIFLDIHKAFDAMDRGRCLQILEDAGVGPKALRLIRTFWDKVILVCRASGYHGSPFSAKHGVTQGGPLILPSSSSW